MENLINSGKILLEESNFAKPKMKIWQLQCERTLTSLYDEEIAKEFSRNLSGGAVIRHGMNLYREIYRPRIQNAVTFLEVLSATDLPQVTATKGSDPHSSPQTMTISGGTVIFGDNATVNNITVREVLSALEKEIESKSPEGESKRKALNAIKSLTSNETVANIVGQTLGAFLSHTIK